MQVLINISKEVYGRLCILNEHGMSSDAENYILNGTVLPEHGRLIDGDYLYKKFEANGCKDSNVYRLIKDEPTILEATGVINNVE